MKEKILNEINDFVNTCYTMFKIGAGDFAKENFTKLIENTWDDSKTDEENFKEVKSLFENNAAINESLGHTEVAKTIRIFMTGWLDKIDK